MESNERDIFQRLDRDIGRDLSSWRQYIIERFEQCCLAAYDVEEARAESLDLNDPTVRDSISQYITNFLGTDWLNDETSPLRGDYVAVTGETYWHTFDATNGDMATMKLPAGHKLQGEVAQWDIRPYIDEEGLEQDVHTHPEELGRHVGLFGVHLVLDHPTMTDEQGRAVNIMADRVYLPLHYQRATLTAYPTR